MQKIPLSQIKALLSDSLRAYSSGAEGEYILSIGLPIIERGTSIRSIVFGLAKEVFPCGDDSENFVFDSICDTAK